MEFNSTDTNFELLAILLVSESSGGAHLLFKYPFSTQNQTSNPVLHQCKKSPYSYISSDATNWIIEKSAPYSTSKSITQIPFKKHKIFVI